MLSGARSGGKQACLRGPPLAQAPAAGLQVGQLGGEGKETTALPASTRAARAAG